MGQRMWVDQVTDQFLTSSTLLRSNATKPRLGLAHVRNNDAKDPGVDEEKDDARKPEAAAKSGTAEEFKLVALLEPKCLKRSMRGHRYNGGELTWPKTQRRRAVMPFAGFLRSEESGR